MDKILDHNQSKNVNLGLYLGLTSLLLLFFGVSYYYDDETLTGDINRQSQTDTSPSLAVERRYAQYEADDDLDDTGDMVASWMEDSRDTDTYFTRVLHGSEDGQVLYEDDLVAAVSAMPARAPVHFIIFPKKPVKNLSHAVQLQHSESMLGRLMLVAEKLARKLEIVNSGYRIVINNGRDSDQVIQHLHLHVLGGQSMGWPPWPVSKNDLTDTVDVDYIDIPDDEPVVPTQVETPAAQPGLPQSQIDDPEEDAISMDSHEDASMSAAAQQSVKSLQVLDLDQIPDDKLTGSTMSQQTAITTQEVQRMAALEMDGRDQLQSQYASMQQAADQSMASPAIAPEMYG